MIGKDKRLKKSEVEYLLAKGIQTETRLFIARYKPTEEQTQYSIVISRKFAPKAVDRNRIKRQTFEAIRLTEKSQQITPKPHKIVLIPKKHIKEAKFTEIQEDITKLIKSL